MTPFIFLFSEKKTTKIHRNPNLCGLSLCLSRIISGKIDHCAHILTLDLLLSHQGYNNQVRRGDDTAKRERFAILQKILFCFEQSRDGFRPSAQEWPQWSCGVAWGKSPPELEPFGDEAQTLFNLQR